MIVSLIAAVAENGAIGKDNDLIWHLPIDMRFFRDTTVGHFVIMGRRNYDSIPDKYRPLAKRTNVIVTRRKDLAAPNCLVVNSIEEGIEAARCQGDDEVFVIGGGQIYKQALEDDLIDVMYLTHVNDSFDADVYFPDFDKTKWKRKLIASYPKDEKHPHSFDIYKYVKKDI